MDFLHYVTQINCLTGAIISETYIRYILRINIFQQLYAILHSTLQCTCSHTHICTLYRTVCDQLLWIYGYSCTYKCFLTIRSKHASSIYFSIFIIQIVHNITTLGKDNRKKDTSHFKLPYLWSNNLSAPSCVCVCSFCFWEEVSNSWILNGIGRKPLLGNGKKIAKFFNEDFYLPLYLPLWSAGFQIPLYFCCCLCTAWTN